MKKNIVNYVTINSTIAKWLKDNLPACEFKESIETLLNGNSNSIVVELAQNTVNTDTNYYLKRGNLVIQPKARKVERDGIEVSLTPKEFDILLFLAKNQGEVFTKEQIYQAVWDEDYALDDSNIMAFIRKLRKKIEINPDAPEYILTIWGIGYKFNDNLKNN